MGILKTFLKYLLWIIAFYLFTSFLIFVGFNASYKNIESKQDLPKQITIDKAEATKNQGRIYGYVQNNEQNTLNGKYIKIAIFNSADENITTQYLKIENLGANEKQMFRATYTAENSKYYEIEITENN